MKAFHRLIINLGGPKRPNKSIEDDLFHKPILRIFKMISLKTYFVLFSFSDTTIITKVHTLQMTPVRRMCDIDIQIHHLNPPRLKVRDSRYLVYIIASDSIRSIDLCESNIRLQIVDATIEVVQATAGPGRQLAVFLRP